MVRNLSFAAGAVTVALLATACGSKGESGGSSGDTLVLGAPYSNTGALAREGQLTKQGYDLCKETINAKGGVPVGGRKLKIDIRYSDDTSKADVAARIVDRLNDDGVKLVLGPYGSASTAAAAPVVERNKQVMADAAGADDKIFQQGYKRSFAVLSPATEYAASMVKAIDELAVPKPKTIAFLSADDGFSKTVAEGGVAEARTRGYTVFPTEYFPAQATDVSAVLTKIKGKKPDVIVGSVHLVEGIAIIKQANELGVKPKMFAESVAPPTPDFRNTLRGLANGVIGSSQWTAEVKGSEPFFGTAKDYAAAIQTKYGHPAQYHNAEATAACLALATAAQKAGSTEPDKVRDAMAALDTASFFGRIKFDATGQNKFKPMSVIQVQAGKVVTVWPKDAAAAKLSWPGR
ncbi:amino acid ABC transporter substrate-binding protein [Spirillospora sp. NPDC048911]|uniref:amino acid ABC transporter substrate-binding protein n=1 Tax=Spirillospora sp. NPDC048911 TaxID=3364527 RepID=UPI0037123682